MITLIEEASSDENWSVAFMIVGIAFAIAAMVWANAWGNRNRCGG